MKKLFSLLIFSFVILTGCSKNDNPASSDQNDSYITGKWKMEFDTWNSSSEDSLGIKLDVKGNNGTFSGTGEMNYLKKRNGTTTRYKFTDNTTGTYSQTELKFTCKSSVSGDTFTFTGNSSVSSSSYNGKVTLLIRGETTEFNDISVFKY